MSLRERPAVAVIDIESLAVDGIVALVRAVPGLKIVAVVRHDSPILLRKALKVGALGFVVCDGDYVGALSSVIEDARQGRPAVCPVGLRHLIAAYAERTREAESTVTAREAEVLALIVKGHTNESIAKHLHMSVGTVKGHVTSILRKLGVSSRTAAAARTVRTDVLNGARPH